LIAILKTFQFPQTPVGIAVDASENVYVVDEISFEVDKITVNGIVSAFAGRNAAGTDFVPFFYSWPIAIDPTGKILYVSDAGNNIIRKMEINDH
jgi:DNA-binding beta-propeller fold protein YncE